MARTHKEAAKDISRNGGSKQYVQQEKKLYSKVEKARWVLLQNKENLDSEKQQSLNEILPCRLLCNEGGALCFVKY